MRYSEIITEDKKELMITSLKTFKTMISHGEVRLPTGSIINIEVDANIEYSIKFPPGFIVYANMHFRDHIIDMRGELTINGDLYLSNTFIETLPKKLKIHGSLLLESTNIKKLPKNLFVKDYLKLNNSQNIKLLSSGLKVGRNLDLTNTNITQLPADLKVGQDLILIGTKIQFSKIPHSIQVSGEIKRW